MLFSSCKCGVVTRVLLWIMGVMCNVLDYKIFKKVDKRSNELVLDLRSGSAFTFSHDNLLEKLKGDIDKLEHLALKDTDSLDKLFEKVFGSLLSSNRAVDLSKISIEIKNPSALSHNNSGISSQESLSFQERQDRNLSSLSRSKSVGYVDVSEKQGRNSGASTSNQIKSRCVSESVAADIDMSYQSKFYGKGNNDSRTEVSTATTFQKQIVSLKNTADNSLSSGLREEDSAHKKQAQEDLTLTSSGKSTMLEQNAYRTADEDTFNSFADEHEGSSKNFSANEALELTSTEEESQKNGSSPRNKSKSSASQSSKTPVLSSDSLVKVKSVDFEKISSQENFVASVASSLNNAGSSFDIISRVNSEAALSSSMSKAQNESVSELVLSSEVDNPDKQKTLPSSLPDKLNIILPSSSDIANDNFSEFSFRIRCLEVKDCSPEEEIKDEKQAYIVLNFIFNALQIITSLTQDDVYSLQLRNVLLPSKSQSSYNKFYGLIKSKNQEDQSLLIASSFKPKIDFSAREKCPFIFCIRMIDLIETNSVPYTNKPQKKQLDGKKARKASSIPNLVALDEEGTKPSALNIDEEFISLNNLKGLFVHFMPIPAVLGSKFTKAIALTASNLSTTKIDLLRVNLKEITDLEKQLPTMVSLKSILSSEQTITESKKLCKGWSFSSRNEIPLLKEFMSVSTSDLSTESLLRDNIELYHHNPHTKIISNLKEYLAINLNLLKGKVEKAGSNKDVDYRATNISSSQNEDTENVEVLRNKRGIDLKTGTPEEKVQKHSLIETKSDLSIVPGAKNVNKEATTSTNYPLPDQGVTEENQLTNDNENKLEEIISSEEESDTELLVFKRLDQSFGTRASEVEENVTDDSVNNDSSLKLVISDIFAEEIATELQKNNKIDQVEKEVAETGSEGISHTNPVAAYSFITIVILVFLVFIGILTFIGFYFTKKTSISSNKL